MIELPEVTLVAVSSIELPRTLRAIKQSQLGIDFGAVLLVSHCRPHFLSEKVTYVERPRIKSLDEYSRFMLYDLVDLISTDFALVIQHDGFVANPSAWDPTFLNYDYIGAPWPPNTHFDSDGNSVEVGNGGFSLRSIKLLSAFNELGLPFTDNGTGYFNEDGQICVYYREALKAHGISFAPVEVARRFSVESDDNEELNQPFGFHANPKFLSLLQRVGYHRAFLRALIRRKVVRLFERAKRSLSGE